MKGKSRANTGIGKIRKAVFERDNWTCQDCGINQEQCILLFVRRLDVHHIDKNHENNKEGNMTTLCCRCHNCISGNDTKFHQGAKGKHWTMSAEDKENHSRLSKIYGFKKGHKNSERQKELTSKRFKGKTYEEIFGSKEKADLRRIKITGRKRKVTA